MCVCVGAGGGGVSVPENKAIDAVRLPFGQTCKGAVSAHNWCRHVGSKAGCTTQMQGEGHKQL